MAERTQNASLQHSYFRR